MKAPAAGLRFALEHGVAVQIEVVGRSMEPLLAMGVKVTVAPLEAGSELTPGELVILGTDNAAVLLLHRVLHVFSEGPRHYVIHQGDSRSSSFGVCPREHIVARVTGIASGTVALPTLEHLGAQDRARFLRRRLAGRGFAAARRLTAAIGVRDFPFARRCGAIYRAIARRLAG